MTTTLNGVDPANVLSTEELALLMERKRKVQAELAANQHSSQAQSQGGCGSGGCGGGGFSCSSSSTSAGPSSATGQQPQVFKALLIAVSILAVAALAWWGVTR
jgi:hypothetical protein